MPDGFSVIKIEDLSKPATVLVEKISDAIGGFFRPSQIRRVAKAEAEASEISACAQIKIEELHRRALTRFIAEEAKKQENIEQITAKAIPQLGSSANPQDMEDDWITNFFDKCRIISDEEMQLLWASVLAGEANSPGTYSKRTVNLLGSLDKADARLFTTLCGFAWSFEKDFVPLVYDEHASIYREQGINFSALTHLDDIGLISIQPPISGYVRAELSQRIITYYARTPLIIEFSAPENNELDIGRVILTKTGEQLAPICGASPIDGFYDYAIETWVELGLVLSSPYPRGRPVVLQA